MGLYIEVENKKEWIENNGEQLVLDAEKIFTMGPSVITSGDKMLVCEIVNNIIGDDGKMTSFISMGVIFNNYELESSTVASDFRDKRWFYVDKELIKKVAPMYDTYIGE